MRHLGQPLSSSRALGGPKAALAPRTSFSLTHTQLARFPTQSVSFALSPPLSPPLSPSLPRLSFPLSCSLSRSLSKSLPLSLAHDMFATSSMILNLPSSYWFRISGLEFSDEGRELRPFHMVGKNLGKSYNCTSCATRIVLASFETKKCTRDEFVPEMSFGLKSKSICKTETLASDERPRLFLKTR